jgi:Flp pilus assembly protein TadD
MSRVCGVVALVALALSACRAEAPGHQPSPRRPVIFVGLDAADWSLLDGYMQRGVMPTLAKLTAEGTGGRLKTISPPLSPLIWTTMMTGTSPLEHRILDFVQFDPATAVKEPITSSERRVPAVWNMASSADRNAAVFGVWATYPAEAINGLVVSDRLFTFLYKESAPPPGVVSPPDREVWARDGLARAQRAVDYDAVRAYLPWLTRAEYDKVADSDDPFAQPVSALRRMLIETGVYGDLSLDWIRSAPRPDLTIVYLQSTDTVGHVFAPYAPPRQAGISQEDYDHYSAVPEKFFRALDDRLAQYRDAADRVGGVLMLASDHGFLWNEGRPTRLSSVAAASAAKWHSQYGMYLIWGRDVPAKPGHTADGDVQQVAATLLALAGMAPGRDVNGEPLEGAPAVKAPRKDYAADYRPAQATGGSGKAASDRDAVANLRSLGYIGAGESNTAPPGSRGSTRTAGSFNNEGVILKERGRLPQAIEAFERALTVDPKLASAEWNLSDVLYAMGQNLDRSDALLLEAFAHGMPDGGKFVVGRAIAYQRGGNPARSLTLMNAAVAANGRDPELWLFRGRYRVEQGDCRGAASDFDRALALARDNAAAHAASGVARMCAGDRAGARAAFERSLQIDPEQPEIREYIRNLER